MSNVKNAKRNNNRTLHPFFEKEGWGTDRKRISKLFMLLIQILNTVRKREGSNLFTSQDE
jgi:hypothetical protein